MEKEDHHEIMSRRAKKKKCATRLQRVCLSCTWMSIILSYRSLIISTRFREEVLEGAGC